MAFEGDKTQTGGEKSGLGINADELYNLLLRGDNNRNPIDIPSPHMASNDYNPSTSSPMLQGNFRSGDLSMPIFAQPIRFPHKRLLNEKQNRIIEAARRSEQQRVDLSLEMPEMAAEIMPKAVQAWEAGTRDIYSKARKADPVNWAKKQKLPGSELSVFTNEFKAFASTYDRLITQIEVLKEDYKGKSIPDRLREPMNAAYSEIGKFFSEEEGVTKLDIGALNKFIEDFGISGMNYLKLLNEESIEDVSGTVDQIRLSKEDPSTFAKYSDTGIDIEAAKGVAKMRIKDFYQFFKQNSSYSHFKLPATVEEFEGKGWDKKRDDVYTQYAEDWASTHARSLMVTKYSDIKETAAQKAAAKKSSERVHITPEGTYTVNLGATGPIEVMVNGKLETVNADNIQLDKTWDLSTSPVEFNGTIETGYQLGEDGKLKRPSGSIKGKIVRVGYGSDPFDRGKKKKFMFIQQDKMVDVTRTTTKLGDETMTDVDFKAPSTTEGSIIMVPVDNFNNLNESVNLESVDALAAETDDGFRMWVNTDHPVGTKNEKSGTIVKMVDGKRAWVTDINN